MQTVNTSGNLGSTIGSNGLLRVVSNDQIDRAEREKIEKEQEQNKTYQVMTSLAGHIRTAWDDANRAKQNIERVMLQCINQRKGEYSTELKAAIASEGGSETFLMITDVKCRAAESWIRDILGSAGDKAWMISPTPIPDMSPQIQQNMMAGAWEMMQVEQLSADEVQGMLEQAKGQVTEQLQKEADLSAERMTSKIEDQLAEGGFDSAFSQFVTDLATYPAAFIEGPILKKRKTLKWGKDFKPVLGEEIRVEYERISPFDVYPSAQSTNCDDGDLLIRRRLSPGAIHSMSGLPGSKDDEITQVLEEYGRSGLKDWLSFAEHEREVAEGRETLASLSSTTIDALQYRGRVQGKMLIEWGMPQEKIEDHLKEYDIEAWLVGRHVIKCILNPDPLDRRPIFKASAVEQPGSFWGMGIPQLMADIQEIVNAAIRALVDNLAIASGPQVGVDASALPDGESVTNIYPWKVWNLNSAENGSGKLPLEFYQPAMHTAELLSIYERFGDYADQVTGIPAYTYGGDTGGGAASTASGLSMLMGAASKGIKQIIRNIDMNVVEHIIERTYIHNMLYDEDQSIKGDLKVQARGSAALIQKETTQLRRMEFLASTNNEIDMAIIGMEGRAEILRETVKSLDMPTAKIVPDAEKLMALQNQQAQMEQAQMQQGQI